MRIYCDESGNTGLDLLNEAQPIFSIASTNLDADTCSRLVRRLLRQGQTEAKYSKLKGSASGQRALVEFFSAPELTSDTVKFLAADKDYYVITHLVDKLIEPPLHEAGHDLYKDDAHVGLVNLWYFTGHTIFRNGDWRKVKAAFVRALRERNPSAFGAFDDVLGRAAVDSAPENRDFVTGLLLARGRLPEFIGVLDADAFDPANDMFINLINKWMALHPGQLEVVHDQSKPLKRNERFLRSMMQPVSARMIGYGKRKAELPLRVSKFEFADSKDHPQLQLADIVAGAVVDCLLAWSNKRPANDYHKQMQSTRLASLEIDGMLPSIENIVGNNPPGPGESNLVDGAVAFMTEIGATRGQPT
ncbi:MULTISPECIES: DUF3800 domain-containing protein [unclassified Variovorax]|uniref:DUF3800 domain-containing protein n=1 Tax=unclassified Variovorax TaxID=663243 RepID=UPI000F7E51E2|nr:MULTISPECIES: DUF3800 domain-containing protein [unclassified Variovorax]RSZ38222.1 DUF3800 domain-containing protein [Variovorax sp. 553]RSZ39327.1 DUF3800 domain-containing protein [Variovorax sp. 679]